MKSNTRKYFWTGTIVTKAGISYEFGAEEIVKGSGYISRQCCGSTKIELGTVYAAEMGITLLSDIDRYTLEEKADHIYEQGKNLPVAYASNNVNSGSNVARGSLNQTESKKLDNGYKFVWEFTPSQGKGNIAAVALTSALGGQNAFGSAAGDATAFQLLKKVDIGDLAKARQMDAV